MLFRVFVIFCVIMFSGCNSYTFYHGYPSSSVILWKNIKVGDSSDTIIRILGNPILKEGNTWFYVSYKIYTNNTFAKRQYSSDLLKLTFDNNKVLKLEEIKISKRKLYEIYKKSSLVGGINDSFLRRMQLKLHN